MAGSQAIPPSGTGTSRCPTEKIILLERRTRRDPVEGSAEIIQPGLEDLPGLVEGNSPEANPPFVQGDPFPSRAGGSRPP